MNDAQHQLITVDFNRTRVSLYVASRPVGQSVNEIKRLMSAGQTRDLGHDR
ncbi:hypothetical protein D3C85_1826070 [compost metagenome]